MDRKSSCEVKRGLVPIRTSCNPRLLARFAYLLAVSLTSIAAIVSVPFLSTASAGTAEVIGTFPRVTYTDEFGEENTVTLTLAGAVWTISDTTSEVDVGSGCSSIDLHTASCSPTSSQRPRMLVGELDDTVINQSSSSALLNGGPGKDHLYAGSAGDNVSGGEGADLLQGGADGDILSGGDDDDVLDGGADSDTLDGGLGADTLSGGPGNGDRASYVFRLLPVTLSLDGVRNDGEEDELDLIGADVEQLEGGAGNDSMIGNAAGNYMFGGLGSDVLDVGPVDAAPDGLYGGEGDDTMRTRDGGLFLPDSAACEAGFDQAVIDYNDSVFECEAVDSTAAPPPPPGPQSPGPPLPPPDRLAPVISGLAVSPRSLSAAPRGGSIAETGGANVSYRLSERGQTTFRLKRAADGRRVGKRCVSPTRRNRRARSCTRHLTIPGSFTHLAQRGSNSFRFTGRLAAKKLRPGKHWLVARARDGSGNVSASAEAAFGIKR